MKHLIASVLALGLGTSAAMAGGPVVVTEEPTPVVAEKPASSIGIVPLLLITAALVAVVASDN